MKNKHLARDVQEHVSMNFTGRYSINVNGTILNLSRQTEIIRQVLI